jgi:hypothetical protein
LTKNVEREVTAASAVLSGKGKVLHPARFGLLVHDQAF